MNTAKALHREAMQIVDDATLAKKRSNAPEAKALLLRAYETESRAAEVLRNDFGAEPSRAVLFRSAASLAMQCGLFTESEKLLYQALAGQPPEWIIPELRELLDEVSFHHHLKIQGLELTNIDVQVVLEGPAIGPGIAPTTEIIPRVEGTNLLFFRTAERLANKEYRETGPPTNEIRDQAQAFMTLPRAASYAFSLRIGKLIQMSFEDPSERVLNEFIDCLALVDSGDEVGLREKIKDAAYYNNFVALAKGLFPDGEHVKTVGFTVKGNNFTRELALRQSGLKLASSFPPARSERTGRIATGTERRVQVSGQLRLADSTHENNRLKLVQENGSAVTVYVPEGMMTDIVKPLWDEWVTIEGLKMGRVLTLLSIDKMR